jgi:hypothetical protein
MSISVYILNNKNFFKVLKLKLASIQQIKYNKPCLFIYQFNKYLNRNYE